MSSILGNHVVKRLTVLNIRRPVRIRGINPYVVVNERESAKLKPGWRKPLPVLMRINGKPSKACSTNMMPVGDGDFYLYLNGPMRKAATASVGDIVQVEIEFNSKYRNGPQHPMPRWFRQTLKEHPKASKNWLALVPSRKREVLRYFAQLKSQEARDRNLERAIHVLSGHTARFMARTWTNGC